MKVSSIAARTAGHDALHPPLKSPVTVTRGEFLASSRTYPRLHQTSSVGGQAVRPDHRVLADRLEYGESRVLGIGSRTSSFTGWFDQVMAFAFDLPNLVVAETYLRALCSDSSSAMRKTSLITLYVSAALVSVGVYSQW